jgi:hypothetical protein
LDRVVATHSCESGFSGFRHYYKIGFKYQFASDRCQTVRHSDFWLLTPDFYFWDERSRNVYGEQAVKELCRGLDPEEARNFRPTAASGYSDF